MKFLVTIQPGLLMMPSGEGGKSCLYHDGDEENITTTFKLLSDLNNKQITLQKPPYSIDSPHIPFGPRV